MVKSYEELTLIYYLLLDYYLSGEMAIIVLKTVREEYRKSRETKDDMFIGSLILSSYNMAILTLANTIKPHSDSVHLNYLFNCLRDAREVLNDEAYINTVSFISECETALNYISHITDSVIKLRDTSIAHLDRKKINNPTSLILNPPIQWDDLFLAYSIVGSGLMEIGRCMGIANLGDYTAISSFVLAKETRQVYRLFYGASTGSQQ